jgi:hypothetical protein
LIVNRNSPGDEKLPEFMPSVSDEKFYLKFRNSINDNQRFETWSTVVKDVNARPFQDSDARYPMTGWSMGNFKYTFHFGNFLLPI